MTLTNRRSFLSSTSIPGPPLSSLQIVGILVVAIYLLVTAILIKTFHSTTTLFGVDESTLPQPLGHISRFLDQSVTSLGRGNADDDRPQRMPPNTDFDGGKKEITSNEVATTAAGAGSHGRVLTAYLEPVYQSDWKIKPLPRRNSTASVLRAIAYPKVSSCSRLPESWPVDNPPTDIDPFLPWIHDVFPTADGKYIQFVAQNRRRCQSGRDYADLKAFLQPNIALFQHIPLARVHVTDDASSASWGPRQRNSTVRYRLSSHEEADQDGIETRFICRFSTGPRDAKCLQLQL